MNFCGMACDILTRTNDGGDLSPEHLKLLENAVNGFLNEKGERKFKELHEEVTSGKYKKPFLHGVEHLTIDHEGYVYWKGKHVEHYDLSFAFSAEAKNPALELAERCKHLERKCVPVNVNSVIWNWNEQK
ncbi:MAG: hypothetical protein A3G33_08340 [Omnitrophica bacterium RIFCSPLOWO2_12_FULL_44_17]|uniref:Uncharacterized protein n=1 Tax=Candidatus Danuiimicrobium aquiferis TaxID=1801832 RepID=A0A1G1KW66_9BACT|nr:MAG: hypothetical protein A3B72_03560 [Omnitrophica bacterium RIFCSPHIGHO2_02_FULL_45_28]OGW90533.1 MAG: hypothetical protein A3E74_03080 [Omnitrophica bacterium RIFCSPHIGHO2_12_FULL_44_12]OGW97173.1 MAG: hypothetical protein A3G33_08340 [Omnitrophica bacterium RIFCSPLOWO2_12_FULL_44_17]OGX02232.1 MAG: hypothetical protein A3J12_08125 [Omnitrophica bacterium RIFCSPLOWO2_02_FULL_44_11]